MDSTAWVNYLAFEIMGEVNIHAFNYPLGPYLSREPYE